MILIVGGSHQGKYKYATSHYEEKNIWNEFHLFVKEKLEEGIFPEEIEAEVNKRISSNSKMIIISDELGCGIVPFTKEDREYRELTGRLLCKIAEKSESVFRMICGITQRIK
ncbi:bifunctional adenosylcobinamide kinase/adenosylcobinamide-phosphate guanylyltransferase [Treponema sp.]|uniref:bifunctional adenosylcobinamide kinase/adenosylcobinamide-phosphate guanylyltransferase n=1 Tax=Treponema sp. TaxID=166 RepID=UPI00298DB021|nr:bifunctional adenosylcobinamide kinase/adenosylcobinamide-phosphate guanylyltransferase [Treponema sp.]MCQ2240054.1 bifunctional adenosylcobinamide kinase/adenosylcobinamide-phosphate guanylyltransferase [Treponema sp.]